MLSRHLLVCSCRPRARTQQGSGPPRSSPGWGQFAGLATGRVSKWLSQPCPRVWLCGFGVPEPHCSRGRWQGVNLGGAGACPPAWGGPCSGSAAAPLWSPRYCMYSWTSPLQTPGGLPSPAPTTAVGVPALLRPRRRQRPLSSTVAQAADPLCPSGPDPLFMACLLRVTRIFILTPPALTLWITVQPESLFELFHLFELSVFMSLFELIPVPTSYSLYLRSP